MVQQKTAVENQKFQIESTYFNRVQEIEAQGIDRSYQKQLADLKVLLDAKLITQKADDDQAKALEENEQLDIQKLHERTDAEIAKSGIATAKAIREAYQQEFARIQQAMDQVLGRFSDQLANLVTGQKTSFGKMFIDMGHQMTSAAIKNGLQMLLAPVERRAVGQQGSGIPGTGQVGDTLPNGDTLGNPGAPQRQGGFAGILAALFGGHGKKDGSSASEAFWVRQADGTVAAPSTGGSGGSKPGNVLFGNGGLLGTGGVPGRVTATPGSIPGADKPDGSESNPVSVVLAPSIQGPDGTDGNPFYVVDTGGGFQNKPIDFGKNQVKQPTGPNGLQTAGADITAIVDAVSTIAKAKKKQEQGGGSCPNSAMHPSRLISGRI